MSWRTHMARCVAHGLLFVALFAGASPGREAEPSGEGASIDLESSPSRLSDEVVPMKVEAIPERPPPLVEIGEPFLGTGPVSDFTIELPGGAIWRPSFMIYGTARSAVQSFDNGEFTVSEWANRLDLFANLQLSGTERIQLGMRPLDNDGRFLAYQWEPDDDDGGGWRTPFNANLETFFFEGDIGEMLPVLDRSDRAPLDIGIAVGRQPLFFQDGILINDIVDSIGVTRNTLRPSGTSNLRITGLFGWDEIDRGDNRGAMSIEDNGASLFGLFTEMDTPRSTVNFDTIYIAADEDTGDALFLGLSATQRIGHLGTTIRALTSQPFEGETDAVGRGTLLFGEVSWDFPGKADYLYGTGFWAIDRFSSASRDINTGGALGRAGLLFEAIGAGSYGAPLSNQTDSAFGGAIGMQLFSQDTRRQFALEFGGRMDTDEIDRGALGVAARFQQAIGQNHLLRLSGFVAGGENRDVGVGGRVEWQIKF